MDLMERDSLVPTAEEAIIGKLSHVDVLLSNAVYSGRSTGDFFGQRS